MHTYCVSFSCKGTTVKSLRKLFIWEYHGNHDSSKEMGFYDLAWNEMSSYISVINTLTCRWHCCDIFQSAFLPIFDFLILSIRVASFSSIYCSCWKPLHSTSCHGGLKPESLSMSIESSLCCQCCWKPNIQIFPLSQHFPSEVFKLSVRESCKTVSLYYALVAQSASHECIMGRLCQFLLFHLENHRFLWNVVQECTWKFHLNLIFPCIGKTSTSLYKTWGLGPLSPWHGASSCFRWREGLQIRRVATNISNKQSQRANKGWPSSLGVGCGANNPPL
jgi:hypothetical protein